MKIKNFRILIIFEIILSILILNQVTVEARSEPWDGTTEEPTVTKEIEDKIYYEIENAKQLAYIAETGGEWLSRNYILVNDIVLNEAQIETDLTGQIITNNLKEWIPIAGKSREKFTGIFNGNGYKVTGLYIADYTERKEEEKIGTGLFGIVEGEVKNLKIENAYIYAQSYVGSIAGYGGKIDNCIFNGYVSSKTMAGGIVGYSNNYITNCTNYGIVSSTLDTTGGIVGSCKGNIANCTNYGKVIAYNGSCGGIAGSGTNILDCNNLGYVSGKQVVGGIAGGIGENINNCYNKGDVWGEKWIGGIVGSNNGKIINSYNIGEVEGVKYLQGMINQGSGLVKYIGGIAGTNNNIAQIEKCYNIGKVVAADTCDYVGGIVGEIKVADENKKYDLIKDCYYLKDNSVTINTSINGIGNRWGEKTVEDKSNVTEARPKEFFPVYINSEADASYDNLGYPTYTITFKDDEGTILDIQEVDYQEDAIEPEIPKKAGYTFKGWDKEFTNITSNLEITAIYEINKYTVIFQDYNGVELKRQEEVEYLTNATPPEEPTRSCYIFKKWDKDYTSIKEDMIIKAVYTKIIHTWSGGIEEPSEIAVIGEIEFYEIENAQQLAYIAKTGGRWLNQNYILVDDIILNDIPIEYSKKTGELITNPSALKEWQPIAAINEIYTGIFEGNNHKISGIYINDMTVTGTSTEIETKGYRIIWK